MKQEVNTLLYLLLVLYTKCMMSTKIMPFSLFSDVSGFVCPNELILFERKLSEIACMFLCANNGACEGVDYNADTEVCHGCKGLQEVDCIYTATTSNQTTGTKMYSKDTKSFLVSGMLPISDADLIASSIYSNSSTYSAYNSRYCNDANHGWVADSPYNSNQWIQAHFLGPAIVEGIYLLKRPWNPNYVSSYKLSYSADCSTFQYYNSSSEAQVVFQGVKTNQAPVTTMLPYPITALCVRIRPMTWVQHLSLRFDVIGRYS